MAHIDAGTTTVDAGNGTRTLRGVPKDRSIADKGNRSAASLYVRGDITSLHGPGRDAKGQPIPAIDSDFAVERHWRDARLTKIFEGTSEIQLRIVSDRYLPRPGGQV